MASLMLWSDAHIHVLDFEGCLRSGILEYGVVTLHKGEITETRTRLCRPVGVVGEADIAVHGIRPAEVSDAELFSAEWEYFCLLREKGPLAAHFAGAERHLLKSVWPYPRRSPDFGQPGRSINDWGPWIDTGRIYGQLFPELESNNLQALVEAFSYQTELDALAEAHCPEARCRYHAALYDALAATLLLLRLLDRPEFSRVSLCWLLQMSCGARGRERMAQQDLFDWIDG